MTDYPQIFTGEDAVEAFGDEELRYTEEMRRQNEEAFEAIRRYMQDHALSLGIFLDLFNRRGE